MRSSVPPVAALYHLKTGLVTEPAVVSEAVKLAVLPLHIVVPGAVIMAAVALGSTVTIIILLLIVPQSFIAWRRK